LEKPISIQQSFVELFVTFFIIKKQLWQCCKFCYERFMYFGIFKKVLQAIGNANRFELSNRKKMIKIFLCYLLKVGILNSSLNTSRRNSNSSYSSASSSSNLWPFESGLVNNIYYKKTVSTIIKMLFAFKILFLLPLYICFLLNVK